MPVNRQRLVTQYGTTGGQTHQVMETVTEPGSNSEVGDEFAALLGDEGAKTEPDESNKRLEDLDRAPPDDDANDQKRLRKDAGPSQDSKRSRTATEDSRRDQDQHKSESLTDLLQHRQQWRRTSDRRHTASKKTDDREEETSTENHDEAQAAKHAKEGAISRSSSSSQHDQQQDSQQQNQGSDAQAQLAAATGGLMSPMQLQLQSVAAPEAPKTTSQTIAEIAQQVAAKVGTIRDPSTGTTRVHIELRDDILPDTQIDLQRSENGGVTVQFNSGSAAVRQDLEAHAGKLKQAITDITGMPTEIEFAGGQSAGTSQ
ncbi:MAG: type III secretion HpaP family protein [Pseudomonadota bacterium]